MGGPALQKAKRPKPAIRAGRELAILEAAESVFAELGFKGATTGEIALRAGIPKANLHYYFPTKEALYRELMERILTAWLAAAASFDASDDPSEALTRYISAKMDLSRAMPLGSRIWASEIMRGAPVIEDFLETKLKLWIEARSAVIRRWTASGKLIKIEPKVLFYMIWATTQHYADFAAQIVVLNGGAPLDDAQFASAKRDVARILVRGVVRAR